MVKIHYVGNYVHGENDRNLFGFPSAIAKMSYIISALKRAQYKVIVFSTGESQNRNFCYYPRKKVLIDDQEEIVYLNVFSTPFYGFRVVSRIWTWLQMLYYFLFNVKSNDILLVYHSPLYKWPLKIAVFLKKINLYIQVDEIYNATLYQSPKKINKEINSLNIAKGYIFVNDLMNQLFKFKNKPNIICYGDYGNKNTSQKTTKDNIIRLVYAGIIGNKDTDVFIAINAMLYLPEPYQLDIAGYGHKKDIRYLNDKINEINSFLGRQAIVFHGLLNGDTYFSLLSDCHIGLCTRILPDSLSNYTFPSKVLVYLGHDLIPVCSPLTCIKKSKIADSIIYCESIEPNAIAEAILSIDITKKRNNYIIKDLDQQFIIDLQILFTN